MLVDPGDDTQLFAVAASKGDIFFCLLKEMLDGDGVNVNFLATVSPFSLIYKLNYSLVD